MLFNSYLFIFGFLPLTLALFFSLGLGRQRLALAWLVGASLFFYGWWNPAYLGLLLLSIGFNYVLGRWLGASGTGRKGILACGIVMNLALLGYYKYANFLVFSLNTVAGTSIGLEQIVLPLGVSFFTFTQIAYLADIYKGEIQPSSGAGSFLRYVLFVTFFPHLIAGPVVHHRDILPQLDREEVFVWNPTLVAQGLTIFCLGLFKKVVLADGIAVYATPVFQAAHQGAVLTLLEAWGGALAYTLQLYFDFSGYSDMAVGAALLFNIRLPVNFNSPYQAVNIIDFWRRWHISLSNFLRDYLYIPLGGNRKGKVRRYLNLFITMLLGGLWHGAGWTFVAWGGLHGLYLVINHGWHSLRERLGQDLRQSTALGRLLGRVVTFGAVIVAWVIFKAQDFPAALNLLAAMAGLHGIALPAGSVLSQVLAPLAGLGVQFTRTTVDAMTLAMTYLWSGLLLLVVWTLPNSQQWTVYRADPTGKPPVHPLWKSWLWQPKPIWTVPVAVLAAMGVLSLARVSEFLYFQF
ncbi:MBOAT family O-acyltransferase [Anthocerotibacter panamensis]|uniref:MBOAT family O-acyltransferase n=1 Tax=Anthocerotibacter panamensis TaxID=2857077 RepID=UPI001C404771|nr:MBOAT family protein [Anthocerotibacter panamensis]